LNIPWYPRFYPVNPPAYNGKQVVYLKETYVPDEFADLLEASAQTERKISRKISRKIR
jgi:hypothetical protein